MLVSYSDIQLLMEALTVRESLYFDWAQHKLMLRAG